MHPLFAAAKYMILLPTVTQIKLFYFIFKPAVRDGLLKMLMLRQTDETRPSLESAQISLGFVGTHGARLPSSPRCVLSWELKLMNN